MKIQSFNSFRNLNKTLINSHEQKISTVLNNLLTEIPLTTFNHENSITISDYKKVLNTKTAKFDLTKPRYAISAVEEAIKKNGGSTTTKTFLNHICDVRKKTSEENKSLRTYESREMIKFPYESREKMGEMIKNTFNLMDNNNDGIITQAELDHFKITSGLVN